VKLQSLLGLAALGGASVLVAACTGDVGGGAGAASAGGSSNGVGGGASAGVGGGGPNGTCAPATTPRIWRLSDEQYKNVVSDLLPGVTVPPVTTPGRAAGEFINMAERLPVTGAFASSLRTSVKSVAAVSVTNLPGLLQCQAGMAPDACAAAFIDRFVPRAFHRPLDAAERQGLVTLYGTGAMTSQADGIRLVLEAVLQSPSFLYRTELGSGSAPGTPTTLTPYELATALSFLVTDSVPDDELWRVAQDGSLAKKEVLSQQTERLLQTSRAHANIARIFLKWLGLGAGVVTELNAAAFPEYDDALKASMLEESTRFLKGLLDQGGTLNDLVTSRKSFVDSRLAALYGVPFTGASGFVEAMLPPERAGILTQAGVLVSKSRGHAIVIRGKFVRRDIFCQNIPSPPPNINIQMFSMGNLTERQQSTARTSDPVCGACHKMMDPIGISFQKFDALARYVPQGSDGMPADSVGSLDNTDVDGPIDSPVQLAAKIGQSSEARLCLSKEMVTYALGRELGDADNCEEQRVAAEVQAGGGHLTDLIAAIVRGPTFGVRTGGK
jgi:hypothetical protein